MKFLSAEWSKSSSDALDGRAEQRGQDMVVGYSWFNFVARQEARRL